MDWLAGHERGLFLALDGHPRGPLVHALAALLLAISRHGLCWWLLLAAVFLLGGRRGRRLALTAALALLLGELGAWGLRGLAQRALPGRAYGAVLNLAVPVPPFAFPDLRAAAAFAVLPFLARGSTARRLLIWTGAVGTSWAGVWAGIHYPSDVLGGALLGLLAAATAVGLLGSPFHRRGGTIVPLRGEHPRPAAATRRRGRRLRPPTRPRR